MTKLSRDSAGGEGFPTRWPAPAKLTLPERQPVTAKQARRTSCRYRCHCRPCTGVAVAQVPGLVSPTCRNRPREVLRRSLSAPLESNAYLQENPTVCPPDTTECHPGRGTRRGTGPFWGSKSAVQNKPETAQLQDFHGWCPRQESNLCTRFRKPTFYPVKRPILASK